MRKFVVVSLILLPAVFATAAEAQTTFTRPLRMVVGAPPGGGPDTTARILANSMNLGQPVIVENKNGAAQMIAADYVARSTPDGSTMFLASQTAFAVSPVLQQSKIDPLKDFAPVGFVGEQPLVLVANPTFKPNTIKELLALAKSKPGDINFGHGGVGTTPHMTGTLFSYMSAISLNGVSYPGEQASMTDIMGGRIEMMFANASSGLPHVKTGKLKAIAVTSAQRLPSEPNIPTVAEAGVAGFESTTWYGVVVPAATPKAVIAQLNAELNRVLALPEVKDKLAGITMDVRPTTPEAFGRHIQAEHAKWGQLIKEANIKAE